MVEGKVWLVEGKVWLVRVRCGKVWLRIRCG